MACTATILRDDSGHVIDATSKSFYANSTSLAEVVAVRRLLSFTVVSHHRPQSKATIEAQISPGESSRHVKSAFGGHVVAIHTKRHEYGLESFTFYIVYLILPPVKEARFEICSSPHHVVSIHHLNPQRSISVDGNKKLVRIIVGDFGLWQGVVGGTIVNDNVCKRFGVGKVMLDGWWPTYGNYGCVSKVEGCSSVNRG
ncbi:hypothetical protein V6N13_059094 [Hibiscus sabdariffa]